MDAYIQKIADQAKKLHRDTKIVVLDDWRPALDGSNQRHIEEIMLSPRTVVSAFASLVEIIKQQEPTVNFGSKSSYIIMKEMELAAQLTSLQAQEALQLEQARQAQPYYGRRITGPSLSGRIQLTTQTRTTFVKTFTNAIGRWFQTMTSYLHRRLAKDIPTLEVKSIPDTMPPEPPPGQ